MKGQDSFHAKYKGRCRGCRHFYQPGDNIWSPGKGGGAYHIKCQPDLEVRQATREEVESFNQRSLARKRGLYST